MAHSTKPQVKSVTVPRDNDGIVHIEFTDGHRLVFVEHSEFMRAPTMRLEAVWIEQRGKTCVLFHSKHQYPVNRRPFGFVKTTPGWTISKFAEYWTAALSYIDNEHARGRLRKAYRVAACGREDLDEIKAGQWGMPQPS